MFIRIRRCTIRVPHRHHGWSSAGREFKCTGVMRTNSTPTTDNLTTLVIR